MNKLQAAAQEYLEAERRAAEGEILAKAAHERFCERVAVRDAAQAAMGRVLNIPPQPAEYTHQIALAILDAMLEVQAAKEKIE